MEVKGDLNIDGTLTVNNSPVTGGSGLANVVEDTTPQLGGDLDVNSKAIVGADSAGGTAGSVEIDGGQATGSGRAGAVNVAGGSATDAGGIAGSINVSAGDGDVFGGDVNISAGIGNTNGGSVFISPGAGTPGGDGSIFLGRGLGNGSIISFVDDADMSGHKITSLDDPESDTDAVNKRYVDTRFADFYRNLIGASGGSVANDTNPHLGGDLNLNGFSLVSDNSITLLSGADGSGGDGDSIQLQTDLAFYTGAASGGIGLSVGNSVDGDGGSISISAGTAINAGDGGIVSIIGGDTNGGTGGDVTIAGGVSVLGAHGNVNIGSGQPGATVVLSNPLNMGNNKITNLATPTNPADAVTKSYADGLTTGGGGGGFYGIIWKDGTRTYRTDRLSFNGTEFYLEGFRPTLNLREAGIDHNQLANLTIGDPHSQYIRVDGTRAFTGAQSMGSNRLTNVTDPASAQDAATKNYVDGVVGPGFYGVIWSDGTITKKTDRLSFGNQYFYLDGRKPTVNIREAGIDHNQLTNLTAGDPHSQYIRVDGTRAFTADQSHGGFKITSLGTPTAATDGATKAYVDAAVGPGFYGIFIRETDGNPPTAKKDTIIFDSTYFYIQSNSVGIPIISERANGMAVNDGLSTYGSQSIIGFSNTNFYLSRGTGGRPVVNLRQSLEPLSAYLDLAAVGKVAMETWAEHPSVIEDILVVCRAGSATGGFYIVPAANPTFRDGIKVTGADPITISSTPQAITPTANKTLSVGDALFLNLYINGNAKGVRVKVRLRKL